MAILDWTGLEDDDLREFAAPLMHDILRVTMTLGPFSGDRSLRSISTFASA